MDWIPMCYKANKQAQRVSFISFKAGLNSLWDRSSTETQAFDWHFSPTTILQKLVKNHLNL